MAVPEHLRVALSGFAWAWAMRIERLTWRRRVIGREVIDTLDAAREPLLIVVWHGHYRPLLACVRDLPCVLVSTDSFRGRIIRAAAERLGHRCVLRPAELRGEAAFEWLCEQLRDASRVVLVADGPAGPPRRVKRGVIRLASRRGLRIVPCAAASAWAYTRRRWDAQELPLPLSRVVVQVGEALPRLPGALCEKELTAWRERCARAIDACRRAALGRVGRGADR